MGLSIKFDNKEFPEDQEFSIGALGVFKNGEAREIDKEQEQAFVDERRISVRDALANDPNIEVSGTATAKVPEGEPETMTTETTVEEEGGES